MSPKIRGSSARPDGSVQPGALPPHLQWMPIRHASPAASWGRRVTALVLAGLVSFGYGTFLLVATRDHARRPSFVSVSMRSESPVYELTFKEPPKPAEPQGGGSEDLKDDPELKTHHFGDALELPATPADLEPIRDLDEALRTRPGLMLTDTATGRVTGGSGGGSGGGTGGGVGLGRGRDRSLLSSAHTDGIVLKIEDMAVEHREVPDFPRWARDRHIAGCVVVEVLVSEEGIPLRTEMVSSVLDLFTDEVMKVMPLWRFKPVRVDGANVKVRVRVLFDFKYEEFVQS